MRRRPRIFCLGAMPKRSAGMFPSLEHACAALRHGTRRLHAFGVGTPTARPQITIPNRAATVRERSEESGSTSSGPTRTPTPGLIQSGRQIALCIALCCATLIQGCREKKPDTPPILPKIPPILLLAVDGLEWDVMIPMLRDYQLPHLRRLMDRGNYGLLRTFEPTMSPVVWTSIATGKTPDKHGIYNFARPGLNPGDPPVLYSNRDRTTKALWNIANDYGKRVAVVGWWMTFPVEPVNGVMVAQTNTLRQLDINQGKNIWKGRLIAGVPGQVHPPHRRDEMMAILAQTDATLPALIESIFGRFKHPKSLLGERLWSNCLWSFRADATYVGIARALLSDDQPYDLMAVYLGGPDVVGHRFWRFRRPELFDHRPTSEQVANFGRVIEHYYAYVDRVVGELVELAGASARVLVVSDHGMQPINRTARFDPDDPPNDVNSAHHMSAPPGVIIAAGPHLRRIPSGKPTAPWQRSDLMSPASVLDITPTLLALMNIPMGADMQGHVAEALIEPGFLALYPLRVVATHDTQAWLQSHRALSGDDLGLAERIEQLRSLGYIGDD